jgi:hypothetical protein
VLIRDVDGAIWIVLEDEALLTPDEAQELRHAVRLLMNRRP